MSRILVTESEPPETARVETEKPRKSAAARLRAQRMYTLIEVLYATGLRVFELAGLPLAAVSRDGQMLIVRGKGGKERMVPLGDPARDAIGRYLEARAGFIPTGQNSAFLFPSASRAGHLTPQPGVSLPVLVILICIGKKSATSKAIKNPSPLNYTVIPRAVYCQPQVASWGISEPQANELNLKFKIGRFPFSANGKALGLGEGDGFVKVIVGEEYGELLGAHLIGPEVTEILAELSIANLLEGTVKEVGLQIHAHPTLSEAVKEAALAAEGEAIHI